MEQLYLIYFLGYYNFFYKKYEFEILFNLI
jgi:hypothetical protein